MKFAKFERAEGTEGVAYINPDYVRSVISRTNGGSTVWIEGEWVDVLGTAADVVAALERAAAGLDEAPVDAPAKAEREVLPLWQRSRDEHYHEVFTRGAPDSARVVVRWHPAVGFIPSVDGRAGCYSATSSAAMRDADTMAAADGYELTADDMRLDPDLACEVSGLEFNLDAEGFEPRLSGLGGLSFQRFAVMSCLAPDVRNSAMARVLRAHGAIVTEVGR